MSAWTNLRAIVTGFKNVTFPSESFEKLAKERSKVCAACPHARPDHPFKKLLPNGLTEEIKGMGCNLCGCLLSAKVRQILHSCPDGRWE